MPKSLFQVFIDNSIKYIIDIRKDSTSQILGYTLKYTDREVHRIGYITDLYSTIYSISLHLG